MKGYAIIKADFQHACGMAFVLGTTSQTGPVWMSPTATWPK